ncbi:MAG: hypothetical protein LBT31_09925 [Synergistaceae bacterium]|jgi:hypothetical protein|nr:hypothetical protein [Synergistaceae bacterium]
MNIGAPDKLDWLVGDGLPEVRPLRPYSDAALEFLGGLSDALLRDRANRAFPDVVTFAFFCRRANASRLKNDFGETANRLGRGLAFHITPSNIPINFAFSLVFGLLSGNSNVVRVPTRDWPQVDVVCRAIRALLERPEYEEVKRRVALVRYGRNDEITAYFSGFCDARIIWGGDEAVTAIRKIPIPPRSVEVTFADRFSCCALLAEAVLGLDNAGLERLAAAFYNDTYLVDQNACSSPNLIMWLGKNIRAAKDIFWPAVERAAAKYDLEPAHATGKYALLCGYLAGDYGIKRVTRHGNLIYRAELDRLDAAESLRGLFGLFFEYDATSLRDAAKYVTSRWQTLTYFGFDPAGLVSFVTDGLFGIDRVVPVGNALDIGVIWDGYDLIRTLSRIVSAG